MRVLSLVLVFTLSLFCLTMSVTAVSYEEKKVVTRDYEYLVCTVRTEVWEEAPYSQNNIDNNILLYVSPGDKMNIRGYYTDPHGGTWWLVNVFYCAEDMELIMPSGVEGYVSTSCVTVVHEGP